MGIPRTRGLIYCCSFKSSLRMDWTQLGQQRHRLLATVSIPSASSSLQTQCAICQRPTRRAAPPLCSEKESFVYFVCLAEIPQSPFAWESYYRRAKSHSVCLSFSLRHSLCSSRSQAYRVFTPFKRLVVFCLVSPGPRGAWLDGMYCGPEVHPPLPKCINKSGCNTVTGNRIFR